MIESMDEISLAIVDNDELTLRALIGYLHSVAPRISVVWAVTKGTTAIRRCLDPATRPDMLLVDMSLSGMSGVAVIRQIRRQTPCVPTLAITSFPLEQYAEQVSKAGGQGIVAKRELGRIVTAIECVANNGIWAGTGPENPRTSSFTTALRSYAAINREDDVDAIESGDNQDATGEAPPQLSPRERQILDMYAHGRTSVQVADLLGLSVNTVKTHTTRIFDKLNVANRGQAIAVWMSNLQRAR